MVSKPVSTARLFLRSWTSLLSIGVGGILLPAVYHFALSGEIDDSSEWQKLNIMYMSHGVSSRY